MACILLLGFISLATMYSTDGGKILFHTKSHFTKLIVFTIMMLIFSFINIKFWFSIGYFFYVIIIGLLIWTYLFGIKSSGSQRWIDLYFINLQPSLKELINDYVSTSDKILAKIIVDHESPFLKSIIINKGSKDNIKIGTNIYDQAYLVGRVMKQDMNLRWHILKQFMK